MIEGDRHSMPTYRIHRMKDHVRQHFRWSAHTLGTAAVKPRDFAAPGEPYTAASPYALWQELLTSENALQVGDLLEAESGALYLFKYLGFEDARWVLPEPAAAGENEPAGQAPAGADGVAAGAVAARN